MIVYPVEVGIKLLESLRIASENISIETFLNRIESDV